MSVSLFLFRKYIHLCHILVSTVISYSIYLTLIDKESILQGFHLLQGRELLPSLCFSLLSFSPLSPSAARFSIPLFLLEYIP